MTLRCRGRPKPCPGWSFCCSMTEVGRGNSLYRNAPASIQAKRRSLSCKKFSAEVAPSEEVFGTGGWAADTLLYVSSWLQADYPATSPVRSTPESRHSDAAATCQERTPPPAVSSRENFLIPSLASRARRRMTRPLAVGVIITVTVRLDRAPPATAPFGKAHRQHGAACACRGETFRVESGGNSPACRTIRSSWQLT